MDVGQIMMQMSTGIASTVSAPASAEMAAVPAGEQSGSVFAGMLREISPLIFGTSAVVADAAEMGMTPAPESIGATTVLKPADMDTDIMAALLAVVETRDHMPSTAAAEAEDKPEKPVESAQPDALMPQDVALLAAGTKIVLPTGSNSRMPESGQKVELQDKPEKPADPVQPDALMPQDVALLAAGAQIVLPAGDNGRMPDSGQKVELQDKPEKPAESAQPDALMPQDVALLAAGTQIVLSAGGNGRMPDTGQKVEPQADDRNLLQRFVGFAGAVAMPAKQGQPVELSQSALITPKADALLNSETTAGKVDAKEFPQVETKEDVRDMLEKSVSVASGSAGAKMETAVRSAEKTPVDQRPAEEKPTLSTAATAANGMTANEMPAVQAGRSQEVQPAQADANKQVELPADVRVVKASEIVRPNPTTIVLDAVGRKTEVQEDGAPVQLDAATIKKSMEGVSADVTKVSSSSASEKGLLDEGGKDSSDHGMNNHFHQAAAHQQVKVDAGTPSVSTSGAAQKDASHSDMSENVFRQVKEVLANREVKAGSEQITMRLSPEHLGELTLNLKMENQQLKVEIVAANRGVRDALLQQVENLKETLSRQNITMESFDVVTNSGQRGFEQNDRGWKQLAQQQFMAGTSTGGYRYRTPEVEEVAVPRYGMQKQYAMVDVHY